MDPYFLDKADVRAAFDRVAPRYAVSARLEAEIANRLVEHLLPVRLKPERLLDLGAGTGGGTDLLRKQYPKAQVVALDIAPAMLRRAARSKISWFVRRQAVCGDAESLPLAASCIQLIFSNLVLPWCNDVGRVFKGCANVLADGGLLAFSTFGPDTLKELRASWTQVDSYPHVHRFVDMHDLGDMLVQSGINDVVMDAERLVVNYREVEILMQDLKSVAAQNLSAGRSRGLTGSARLERMRLAYEQLRQDGVLPATFEIVYGHGWKRSGQSVSVALENNTR